MYSSLLPKCRWWKLKRILWHLFCRKVFLRKMYGVVNNDSIFIFKYSNIFFPISDSKTLLAVFFEIQLNEYFSCPNVLNYFVWYVWMVISSHNAGIDYKIFVDIIQNMLCMLFFYLWFKKTTKFWTFLFIFIFTKVITIQQKIIVTKVEL